MWFLIILLSLLTCLASIMADPINTMVSNGTCYYAAQKEAPPVFIPCGNVAAGNIPCCAANDNCLSSLACYNSTFRTTYRVGCTDPSYEDPTCPSKHFPNNIWTGLVTFNNTPFWADCDNTESSIDSGSPSLCPSGPFPPDSIIFSDAPTLQSSASLPSNTGMSISWFAGYSQKTSDTFSTTATDSAPVTAAPSSSQTAAPQSTTTVTETSSSSQSPSPSATPSTLSIGALAGIALSSLSAFLLLSALIFYLLRCQRRRRRLAAIPPIEDQIRRRSTILKKDNEHEPRSPGHRSELSTDNTISPVSGKFSETNRILGVSATGGSVSGTGSGIGDGTRNKSPLRYHHYQQYQEPQQQYLQPQRQGWSRGVHELPIDPPRQGVYEMPG